jgi:hypothetical protein
MSLGVRGSDGVCDGWRLAVVVGDERSRFLAGAAMETSESLEFGGGVGLGHPLTAVRGSDGAWDGWRVAVVVGDERSRFLAGAAMETSESLAFGGGGGLGHPLTAVRGSDGCAVMADAWRWW